MTEQEKEIQEEIPREFIRTALTKPVKVRSYGKQLVTMLKDVSLGGVKLEWPSEKQVHDHLTVYFSTDLYFEGNVRWCKKNGNQYEIGVQFPDLDGIAAIYFGEYIEQLQENNSDLLSD